MEEIAELADQGRDALTRHQLGKLADLMARNFALRRRLFGDQALGEENVRMVEVAAEVGAAAKFAGSGGAVVAFCPHGEGQEQELRRACGSAGYECDAVRPAPAQLPV
jgi:glucuronokinase